MPVSAQAMQKTPLANMYRVYVREIGHYINSHAYTAFFRGSGTATNLQQSFAWLLSGFDEETLANGCQALSSQTFSVCKRVCPPGWTVKRWMVGAIMEHHAVNVYQSTPFDGYMFDPWIIQRPMVYTYSEWGREMLTLQLIKNDRAEE